MSWWIGVAGAVLVSGAGAWWLERLIDSERGFLQLPATTAAVRRWRPVMVTIIAALLMAALVVSELQLGCLATVEVRPDVPAYRALYHAGFVLLLVLATAIDFDCYLLPDTITITGMLWGVLGAAWIADAQIAHLWVDWNAPMTKLTGPYIPDWYDRYRILHALAWSGAGLIVGGFITALVRTLSSRILAQEAMGFGDVMLMAMIGSVVGWQAVLLTFAIAPWTGLIVALIGRVGFHRPYLPYGPCLSVAAVVVLFGWSRLWPETRLLFGDPIALAMILAIAVTAMVVLLGLVRVYRSIPTR